MFQSLDVVSTFSRVRTLVGRLDKIEFIVPRLLPRVLPSLKSKRLAYVLISIGIDVLKNNHFKWKKHTVTKGRIYSVRQCNR